MAKKFTLSEWINKVSIIHNNKYDYSKSEYINKRTKICIICPIHGEFWQTPDSHISGRGCSKCKFDKSRKTTEEFINKANIIHFNKYKYNKSIYVGVMNKLIITCPEHGEFEQSPNSHLSGRGCPICKSSKDKIIIREWLINNNIQFENQCELELHKIARNSNKIIVDFIIIFNDKQYIIEYNGKQHYEYISCYHYGDIINFEKQLNRDKVLSEFCEINSDKFELIQFNYNQSKEEIFNKLNKIFKYE